MRRSCMVVKCTVMGFTDEYVNVQMVSNRVRTRVLRSKYNSNTMVYDSKYYIGLLNKCTETVQRALGIVDVEFVKTIPMC